MFLFCLPRRMIFSMISAAVCNSYLEHKGLRSLQRRQHGDRETPIPALIIFVFSLLALLLYYCSLFWATLTSISSFVFLPTETSAAVW